MNGERIRARSHPNSQAERARSQLRQGERRPWEDEEAVATSWFEAARRAELRRRYPVESLGSPEQNLVDGIWSQLVEAINDLSEHELSTLDTNAISGVVPVHSTGSGRVVSIRRFPDGSSLLLVSHHFHVIILILSTLADFEFSSLEFGLAAAFGAPRIPGSSPGHYAGIARAAVIRDVLLQLNFHGIATGYRPRLTRSSARLGRSAITFAMAHEAAHLLIGARDSPDAPPSSHLRSDGSVAESQWGPELAQDRLALRLARRVFSIQTRRQGQEWRAIPAPTVGDQVLSSALVSLVALHVIERGCFLGEATSHGSAIDRLGTLMVEFNPLTTPIALRRIRRLVYVVDTCLFLEPLPLEAWDLLAWLIRARVLWCGEKRHVAVRMAKAAKDSDVVLTARAAYDHTYDYLTSVQGVAIANRKCLDLLRAKGRAALPEVLDLLGVLDVVGTPRETVIESLGHLTRLDMARLIDASNRVCLPGGSERATYVDTWANVVSAALIETPHRNRLFYHLLGIGEEQGDDEDFEQRDSAQ
jgi:hypothetical protein